MTNRAVRVTEEEFGWLKSRREGRGEVGVIPSEAKFVQDETDDGLTIKSVSDRIKTVDDALRYGEVDTTYWEVASSKISSWEVSMKVQQGEGMPDKPVTRHLWKVEVTLKRKAPKQVQDGIDSLIERMKSHSPKYPKYAKPRKIDNPHLLEISINDVHFAKLAWARETGENYDLKIAESLYLAAAENLATKASSFPIEKILLPVGNDIFHFDNLQQTTTSGTQMDTDTRYVKMFETCQMAVIKAIDYLLEIAPVEVVHVPGNHDRLSSWHLARLLKSWYRNCASVTVNDEPTPRKYVEYGKNLIGLAHGDDIKANQLPNLMATEVPEAWARTKFREYHLGHFHKRREIQHVGVDTYEGTVVRFLASICGRDAWHARMGLLGVRAADAYVYSKQNGLAGYFVANVVGESQVA